jgi:hypothetical protein
MESALHDLSYMGSNPCKVPQSGPHNLTSALPSHFASHECYIFHALVTLHEELHVYLEKRLKENGVEIVSAPRSPNDFVFLTTGGPLFRIRFRQGPFRGDLTTVQDVDRQNDTVGAARWKQEDIILRYEN